MKIDTAVGVLMSVAFFVILLLFIATTPVSSVEENVPETPKVQTIEFEPLVMPLECIEDSGL